VDTPLSAPFTKTGLKLQTPDEAAAALIAAIEGLGAAASGGFFDRTGKPLPF
jgi:hypothetical protein